jgi:hypothetical protein
VRRWTLITLIVLLVVLVGAAIYQVLLASRDEEFPGPVPGTSLPPTTATNP